MSTISAVATSAPRERPLEDWLGDARRAESFGVIGAGYDNVAIQALIDAGYIWQPVPGKVYRGKTSIRLKNPNSGIIDPTDTATYLLGTGAGEFDNANASATLRYAPNAVGIIAEGIARPIISGLRIRPETYVDDRYVKAIATRNCSEIRIEKIDASGFSKALGVVYFGNCQGGRLQDVFIHDCSTNSTTNGQLSAVEADQDDLGSNNIDLFDCRAERLTVGPTFLSLWGYQTDGYHFARASTSNIRFHRCKAREVGEGVDLYGYKCKLIGFDAADCYYFGAKMGHGASKNWLRDSAIVRCGIAGLEIFGSDSAATDTADNIAENNLIADIDPNGTFAAYYTACIRLNPNGGPKLPRRNILSHNNLIGGNAKVGLLGWVGAGSDNEDILNRVSGTSDGDRLWAPGVVSKLVPYYE